jgi:hypothetical protein
VIPYTFDDSGCSTVTNGEALAGHATDECFTICSAIECHIADDDVFLGIEIRFFGRVDDQPSSRETFAVVVVGIPFERQADPVWNEGAETLSGGA